MKPVFLNIDLEISTESEPKEIVRSIGEDAYVLHYGPRENEKWLTAIEVECCDNDDEYLKEIELDGPVTPELATMRAFSEVLGKLSPAAQREWDVAKKRIFDFGYEAEPEFYMVGIDLDPRVTQLIEKHRGNIRITVYRNEQDVEQKNGADPCLSSLRCRKEANLPSNR